MGKTLLEVKDLEVSFYNKKKETPAIRKISYTLDEGEVLGIVGESGSGKSVSSHSILQLLPDNGKIKGGQILFEGKDITKMSKKEIKTYSYIFLLLKVSDLIITIKKNQM